MKLESGLLQPYVGGSCLYLRPADNTSPRPSLLGPLSVPGEVVAELAVDP